MTSFRVLVTGSREWKDREAIYKALTKAVKDNSHGWRVILVHGDARGADRMADSVAREMGWSIEKHPARWEEHTDNCPHYHEGERVCMDSGKRRNKEMVELGADVCVAFVKDNSTGTAHCMTLAAKKNIPVIRIDG